MKYFLTVTLLIFLSVSYFLAQDDLPEIQQKDFPNIKITRNEIFDGNSLWGYINGGADIYLEYGLDKTRVQEVEINGYKFKVEIFKMQTTESAYGIFSIYNRKCYNSDSIIKFSCSTPNQFLFTHGEFYISIVNENGTLEVQNISKKIALNVFSRIKGEPFKIPKLFENETLNPYINRLKFCRGILGIQNVFPQWENIYNGLNRFSCHLLPIETDSGNIVIAQIEFSNSKDKDTFLNRTIKNMSDDGLIYQSNVDNTFKAIKEITSTKVYYLESTMKRESLNQFIEVLQNG